MFRLRKKKALHSSENSANLDWIQMALAVDGSTTVGVGLLSG